MPENWQPQSEEATIELRSIEEEKKEDNDDKPPLQSTVFPADEAEREHATALSEDDIAVLKSYAGDPYAGVIRSVEDDIARLLKEVNALKSVKESDTGLAPSSTWDLIADQQLMQSEQPLLVARCTTIIHAGQEDVKYVISMRQSAKYVVGLGDRVSSTDIEAGMRCGVDRQNKMQIQIPLPPRIDPSVLLMTVEEKPDVTYADVGGCKEQIEKMREVVEMPMLNPERFIALGIDPPKGVLLYGPPGTGTHMSSHRHTHVQAQILTQSLYHCTCAAPCSPAYFTLALLFLTCSGKTLLARAVANQTDAVFIRVIGSELVQKYVGEGARMVRELFQMARSKKAAIIFFDEVDAIGGARFDDGAGGDNEVQRTMLQIVTELDGFDARGNVKVLMATNRPDTLDPALTRPGRLDRKIEFSLPDLAGRANILALHSKTMNCDRNIRWELVARLCPNTTGAELRSVCTEAGMCAIRARRKAVTEADVLEAVQKVIKGYAKFSATPAYMAYN